jgi:hypothetical protein
MKAQGRMWSLDALGPAIERLVDAVQAGRDLVTSQPESEKQSDFFTAMREAARENIQRRYQGADPPRPRSSRNPGGWR